MADQPLQDTVLQSIQFDFSGTWFPSYHELKIVSGDFSDVQNVRCKNGELSLVNGYSKLNTTKLSSYPLGRAGFQLRSPHTQTSYVFAQQLSADGTVGKVFVNKTLPPTAGDFVATELHTDAAGFGLGRFVEAPDNNLIYCNGVETQIYGGEESTISSFILATSITGLTLVAPRVFTDEMRNVLTTAGNVVAFVAASNIYLVGSPRPLSAIIPYCSVFNATPSTVTVAEWTGSTWSNLSVTDTTITGTGGTAVTHAKLGALTFASTVATSKPAFLNDQFLYWYKVSVTAGSFTLYHVTMSAPWQALQDMWDGVNRICIQCQVSRSSVYEDYTPEVYDTSTVQYPIAAKFAGLTSSDSAILMFSERQTAFRWTFLPGLNNQTAATLTIKYWNGSAFATVGTVQDGTSITSTSLNKSGTTFWDAPAASLEHEVNMFDIYGYAYELTWSATLTADPDGSYEIGCYPDTIYGIPATRKMGAYKFAFNYKNRLCLAGDLVGKAGHSIDFGAVDTADCFNGADSSGYKNRLYIGRNSSDLVGAVNVFNRFGANIYDSEILLKPTEVYLLDGNGPDSFTISQISSNIGLRAPNSLTTAEIAFEVTKDAIRNIAMWISGTGPILFDAAILTPLRGIELYFDTTKTTCVNFAALDKAHGWFDPTYYDWNICIPSGSAQTTCNVWLRYNLIEKKWFKNNVGSQYVPQATIKVADNNGTVYFYGLIDDGYMVRLEYGNTWNDIETIEGFIITNAMLPTKNMFDITRIRNLKLLVEGDDTYDITYTRPDISIIGAGIDDGYLRLYGHLIEDSSCTQSYWDGDNFVCKQLLENQTIVGREWSEVAGVVSIAHTLVENFVTEINTTAGNFLTAGFLVGFQVTTNDSNNTGPFTIVTITATKITCTGDKVTQNFNTGYNLTLSTLLIRSYYYENGGTTLTAIPFQQTTLYDTFNDLTYVANYLALAHKFKFSLFSKNTGRFILLGWGFQYLVERTNV